MEAKFFAQPYDINARGFYFDNPNQYHEKYQRNLPVEEYEFQFVDGDSNACALAKLFHPGPQEIEKFYEILDQFEYRPDDFIKLCYILESRITYHIDEAVEEIDNVTLFEGTAVDYANDYMEQLYTKDIPEFFKNYFDAEQFANDLRLSGDISEFEFNDSSYIVTVKVL